MKHIKKFEELKPWYSKLKGNYLTKKDQPKDNFNPYLYDNGFGDRYYICSKCDSYKLTPIPSGGFSPPDWRCDNCGEMNYAPKWFTPEEYKEYLEEKEMKKTAKQYNL